MVPGPAAVGRDTVDGLAFHPVVDPTALRQYQCLIAQFHYAAARAGTRDFHDSRRNRPEGWAGWGRGAIQEHPHKKQRAPAVNFSLIHAISPHDLELQLPTERNGAVPIAGLRSYVLEIRDIGVGGGQEVSIERI